MCGVEVLGPTIDSGDLIAIIHPNAHSSFRARLRLSNRSPGPTTSVLQYNEANRGVEDEQLHVRIQ